jgi:RNA methyltransferase, TrmH family
LTPLGPRHHEVRRLRALLRDPRARADEDAFVLEGPRVVAGALDRGAEIEVVYLGPGARRAFAPLVGRAVASGVTATDVREGVIEKVATTQSPQPVLGIARRRGQSVGSLAATGHVVVTVDVSDPGNLGTIMRSAEASGADGLVATGENSVDVHHPKVVRSSAGAIFGLAVAECADASSALAELGVAGRRRLGARVGEGDAYDQMDLAVPCALVVGNEARGIPAALADRIDATVCIPMSGAAESLNVAMAATVLCFEAARQRRAKSAR